MENENNIKPDDKQEIMNKPEKLSGDVVNLNRVEAVKTAFETIDKKVDNALFQIMEVIEYSDNNGIYLEAGFKNNADYMYNVFGYEKASISRFNRIMKSDLLCENYGKEDKIPTFGKEFNKLIKENRQGLRRVKNEFRAYSTSKLYLLSQMAITTVRDICKPSMTYKELEEILKNEKNKVKKIEEKKNDDLKKNKVESENVEEENPENTNKPLSDEKGNYYKLRIYSTIRSAEGDSIKILSDFVSSSSMKKLIQGLKDNEEIGLVKLIKTV